MDEQTSKRKNKKTGVKIIIRNKNLGIEQQLRIVHLFTEIHEKHPYKYRCNHIVNNVFKNNSLLIHSSPISIL